MLADSSFAEMFSSVSIGHSTLRSGARYSSEGGRSPPEPDTRVETRSRSRRTYQKSPLWRNTVSNDSGIGDIESEDNNSLLSTSDNIKRSLQQPRKSLDGSSIANQISPQTKGFSNIASLVTKPASRDVNKILLLRYTLLGPSWTYCYPNRVGISGLLDNLQKRTLGTKVAFSYVPVFFESICHFQSKNDQILAPNRNDEIPAIVNGDLKYNIVSNSNLGRGNFGQVHTCTVDVRNEDGSYTRVPPLRAMKSTYKMSTYRKERDVHNVLQTNSTESSYQSTFMLWMENSLKVELQSRIVGFLLLELATGGSLQELVSHLHKTGKNLQEHEAVFYLSELGCALDFLHRRNFLHLDFKADNVLIHASGHVRLGDLGHALKLESGNQKAVSYLTAGLCTFHLPVEILRDSNYHNGKLVTKATDWFSYGCLAFWLLHNYYPIIPPSYIRSTREYAEYMELTGYNRLPKVFTRDTSKAYKKMVTSLLNPEPSYRLGSKKGFHQLLSETTVFTCSSLFTEEISPAETRHIIESNSLVPPYIPLPL